jgi:hypothetical protein
MGALSVRTVVPILPARDLLFMGPAADGGMIYCTRDGRVLTQESRMLAQLGPLSGRLVAASVSPNGQNAVFFEHAMNTRSTIMHVFVGGSYFRFDAEIVSTDGGAIYMSNCCICDDGAVFCALRHLATVFAAAPAIAGVRDESVVCTMNLISDHADDDDDDSSPYDIASFDLVQTGKNRYRYAAVVASEGVVLHNPLETGSTRAIHGEISLPAAAGLQPQFTVVDLPSPFGTPWPGEVFSIDDIDTTRIAVSPTTVVISNHHYGGDEGHISAWDIDTNKLEWRLSPDLGSDFAYLEGALFPHNRLVAVIDTSRKLSLYLPNGDPYCSTTLEIDSDDTHEFDVGMPTAGNRGLVISRQFAAMVDVTEPLRHRMLALIAASSRTTLRTRLMRERFPRMPPELWMLVYEQLCDLL